MKKHRARKRFGQHFLTDPGVIGAIVDAIRPQASDTIVEIGPGEGAITVPLARLAGHLHLVELDRDLVARLRDTYRDHDNVTVHEADALAFDFASLGENLRIVGNLPYNISTPLLFHLLDVRHAIADMHFMLQKEVVDRMAADPGSKTYGRLGIMLGCYLDVESLFDVDRSAFDPPPEVTSAIVRLRPIPDDEVDIVDAEILSSVITTAFSQRRKTLRNALKGVVSEDDLDSLQIDPGLRPENVAIPDWIALANRIAAGGDLPHNPPQP